MNRLNITEGGLKAIIELSEGDMRKVLNILQSTAMSHDTINEENVYNCVGAPSPYVMKDIFSILMNDSFTSSNQSIDHNKYRNRDLKKRKGFGFS